MIDGNPIYVTSIPKTGSWEIWNTVGGKIYLNSGTHRLRLRALPGGFKINWFDLDLLNSIDETENRPLQYFLEQNYPNPFNTSTTIQFQIPNSEFTTLKIYDILGKEISTLVSKKLNQGNHTYTFDGNNLASGIYYYQLTAGEYREVKKMILLK